MSRKLTIVLILIMMATWVNAENLPEKAPTYNYLSLGTGLNHSAIKDQLNTSLSYGGITVGNKLEFYYSTGNRFFYVGNTFSSGNLYPYKKPGGYFNQLSSIYENFQMHLQWLVLHQPENKLMIYFGPALLAKMGLRVNNSEIGNSALTYEAAFSLGLAVKVEKYFSIEPMFKNGLGTNWKVGYSLSHPLISRVMTPPFLGVSENLLQENMTLLDLKSGYNSVLTQFVNLQMDLSLALILKNQNAIQLEYTHDYMATYPLENKSKTLNRLLLLKLLYNF